MDASTTADRNPVLIVAAGRDESIESCCRALTEIGAPVARVPDVYAAMAHLNRNADLRHVVVDIRQLDDSEMRFLSLTPRYFPNAKIWVPLLEGTARRASGCKGRFEILAPEDLADAVLDIRPAITIEQRDPTEVVGWPREGMEEENRPPAPARSDGFPIEPAAAPASIPAQDGDARSEISLGVADDRLSVPAFADPVAPGPGPQETGSPDTDVPDDVSAHALSTDGGSDADRTGPSLHEAVRQRMAGKQDASIRRTPPGGSMSGEIKDDPPPLGAASADDTHLTPAELDALLRDDGITQDEDGPTYGRESGPMV